MAKRMLGLAIVAICLSVSVAVAAPKATPELVARGKKAYTTNCATCHGDTGDGNGVAGAYLNPKPRDLRVADARPGKHYVKGGNAEQLFGSISDGLPGTAMPPFKHLSEDDRWAIAHFIRAEFQKAK